MKAFELNIPAEDLKEALSKDIIIINEVPYMKKSRVISFCEKFVDHLEAIGKIKIMSKAELANNESSETTN